jgi:hypothetical protein
MCLLCNVCLSFAANFSTISVLQTHMYMYSSQFNLQVNVNKHFQLPFSKYMFSKHLYTQRIMMKTNVGFDIYLQCTNA